ncbi:restriction endonuclease subunit S [Thauera sp. WB-2]|uniref:restriction endonuclease subunit S n=1 Tax=Thauera sp. WB-2 TaxID=2897772 RepID=UPI0022DCFE01|nr:restriction endonuclease subunit S [Thauera sp. WB-2]WBL64304.1 restriction endonuclease subunit S [Thauera sp. WB-2]
MQRYESYKSSDADWLGDVPTHWDVQPLRAVTALKSDKNRPELPVLSVYREYGVILKDSRDDNHNATSLDTSAYKVVKPGDLVVNKMKAWQGSMGVSAHDGIVSPAYITCATRADRVRPQYLHYLLRSSPLIGVYNSLSYGVRVGQWDMHYEDFKQIPIPLPPQEEQERIVAFLDQKTAEIDEAIAKKERLIELLNEQKSIVTNHAVTRGLNPSAPLKDSGIGWLGEIPSHWMVKRVKHLARKIVDGAHHTPTYVDSGVPFLRVTDISGGKKVIDLNSVKRIPEREHRALCQRAFPEKGDVLLSKNGTIGETIVVDWDYEFSIFVSLCLIKLRREIDPHFFCLYFSSPVVDLQLAEGGKRTSVTNLHLEKIKELVLALPPIEEQREIVRMVRNELTPYNKIILKARHELVALNDFKKSLTASVVVGVVRV